MAWRFVLQPNGKLARFSDVVDDFTHMGMTEAEALEFAVTQMGQRDAEEKVRAAVEDHEPWTVGKKGDGTARWRDSLESVERVHGKKAREEREQSVQKER